MGSSTSSLEEKTALADKLRNVAEALDFQLSSGRFTRLEDGRDSFRSTLLPPERGGIATRSIDDSSVDEDLTALLPIPQSPVSDNNGLSSLPPTPQALVNRYLEWDRDIREKLQILREHFPILREQLQDLGDQLQEIPEMAPAEPAQGAQPADLPERKEPNPPTEPAAGPSNHASPFQLSQQLDMARKMISRAQKTLKRARFDGPGGPLLLRCIDKVWDMATKLEGMLDGIGKKGKGRKKKKRNKGKAKTSGNEANGQMESGEDDNGEMVNGDEVSGNRIATQE